MVINSQQTTLRKGDKLRVFRRDGAIEVLRKNQTVQFKNDKLVLMFPQASMISADVVVSMLRVLLPNLFGLELGVGVKNDSFTEFPIFEN